MADIRNSTLFKKSAKSAIDQIKQESNEGKEHQKKVTEAPKEKSLDNKSIEKRVIQLDNHSKSEIKRSVGAPTKFSDPLLKATQAVKISALTGTLLKVLLENYLTEKTRDELIRSAIVEYINLNFERDDKKAIINMLEKQVNEIREKYPVKEVVDLDGNILHNKEAVKQKYLEELKEQLKL